MSSINYNKMKEVDFYKHLFDIMIPEELRNLGRLKENITKNELRKIVSYWVILHTEKMRDLFVYKGMIQGFLIQIKDCANTAEDEEQRKMLCDVILKMPDWWTDSDEKQIVKYILHPPKSFYTPFFRNFRF